MVLSLTKLTQFALVCSSVLAKYTCPHDSQPVFNCPSLKQPTPAKDIRHLRPGNIEVVMALGDSITAGFAAKDLPEEYRGNVYSTGGDADAVTIARNLMQYNPKLTGYSSNTTVPLTPFGSGLNLAVSGAVVSDLPSQIKHMKEKLDKHYKDSIDSWKLMTVFIGANNACACTRDENKASVFEAELREGLSYIKGNFTNTFVNVMTLFNISGVWDLAQTKLQCKIEVPILKECGCLLTESNRATMDDLIQQYNNVTYTVVDEFASLNDPTFTAVVQPGVDNAQFGVWSDGERYLSDVDCFHPSLCSHQLFALSVWNNMYEPVGKKTRSLDPTQVEPFYCPTEDDYIQ